MSSRFAPISFAFLALAFRSAAQNPPVTVTIDAAANRHAISPNIYGVAYGDAATLPDLNCPVNRYGGNSTSRYNWLLNADNRAQDWYFESIGDSSATAGERGDTFFSVSRAVGAQAMLTIPMIGWVAKLGANRNKLSSFSIAKYGAQTGNDWQWFADAGDGILASNGQNVTGNDPNEANVPADSTFQQGWIQHLVSAWGKAANGGIGYYLLDNESSIWFATHRDVHPIGPTMDEIKNKIVDYSAKIKTVDPTAQVVGPEEWGWSGYFYSGYDQQWGSQHNWSSFPDRANHGGQDYMPWLLAQLKQSAANTGQRPLDVFSAHYYPQGGEFGNDTSTAMQLRRNRSTRSLWDPNYVDESWIGDKVQLIPRLKNWVSTYYFADTPVAITEYNWGAESHINGATTQADILGIFGREGLDLAARWTTPDPSTPTYKAIKMYRNYDGSKSGFGDTSVSAAVANPDNLSAFAAVRSSDGALTVMVIGKVLSGSTPVTVALNNFAGNGAAQVYQLTSANSIQHLSGIAYSGTSASLTVPAQSITLLILPKSAAAAPLLSIAKTHAGNFAQGQQNAAYTVTVSNANGAGATSGTVTVTETVPSGLTLASMSGTSWTCGATTCTRSDALAGGASYPAITVKVNVAANATSPQVNAVSVSGGGSATASATDSTNIIMNLPPSAVSVTPSSGSGSSQTFSFVFSDPNGFTDLASTYIGFSSTFAFGNACYSYYDRNANALWLLNDAANAWLGPVTPGAAGTLQNNQCSLSAAGSSVSGAGNNLTVNLALTFKAPFAGAKNVYMCALDNGGLSSNWQQRGAWTVPAAGNLPPSTVSVTPSSNSGSSQTFGFVFSDPNGYTDLSATYMGFSSTFAFGSACYSYYDRNASALWLLNDAANAWLGPITPGVAGTLQNNQCTLSGAGSSASGSGNNLTVNLALTFKTAFAGAKNIYMCALDNSGLSSNWQQRGAWTVPNPNNQPPATVSVTPSSGSGSSQTFSFVFSDPNGFTDLSTTYLGFNSTFTFSAGCYSYYDRNANALWLLNDAASGWLGPVTPAAAGTLQNNQCTLNAAGSSASGSGNNLTVNVALSFKAAFAGAKNVYMCALDNSGASSNWQQRGAWTAQ